MAAQIPDAPAVATNPSIRNIAILLGGLTTVVGALAALIESIGGFGQVIDRVSTTSTAAAAVTIAVGAVVAGLVIRAAKATPSKLERPDQLALRIEPDHTDHLRGRDADTDSLARACLEVRQVFLTGESGTGKTALLRAGLCNALASNEAVLAIYVGGLGREWGASEFECLELSARAALAQGQAEAPFSTRTSAARIEQLVLACRRSGRTPLIIFDQFDDYVAFHWDRFLRDGRTWCSRRELVSSNAFWAELGSRVAQGEIRVLFVATPEFSSAFDAVRFVESSRTYRLPRVHDTAIKSLLLDLSESRPDGAPVVTHPEGGWRILLDQLVADLARDGLILPAQLKVALEGLRNLKSLTVHEYTRIGRLRGLEAAFIERHIADAVTQSGYSKEQVLQLLKAVVNEKDRKTEPRTLRELAETVAGEDAGTKRLEQLNIAIDVLTEPQRLMRKSAGLRDGEETYALRHDYLARGVMEADARTKRWALLLANSRAAFGDATGLLSKWRALLPVSTQLTIAAERLQRRIRYGEHRRYALISCLRIVPLILLPCVYIQAADAGASLPGAERLRKSLDKSGWSLWRTPPTSHEVQTAAWDLRQRLVTEVERRTVDGWVSPVKPDKMKSPRDPWTHAQASAAIMHGSRPEVSADSILDVLLDSNCEERRITHGTDYGWVPAVRGEEPLSEPALWAFLAASERMASLPSGPLAFQWQDKLDTLSQILAQYKSSQRGWNLFAKQSPDSPPSTHATVLALSALITVKSRGIRLAAALPDADDLVRDAMAWLISQYKITGSSRGWAETYVDSPVCDGLTFQVLATLLRIPLELGWNNEILEEYFHDIPEHLDELLVHGPSQHGCYGVVAAKVTLTKGSQLVSRTQVLDFPWFPWAIELAVRFGELSRQRRNLGDLRLSKRVLARLVGEQGAPFVNALTADVAGTYRISELLYAIGSFIESSALHHEE